MHEYMKKVLIAALLVVSAALVPCLSNVADFPDLTSALTHAAASPLFWQFWDQLLGRELAQWKVAMAAVWQAQAQEAHTKYPTMAPLDQYMMLQNTEIELARSAAPESISYDAEVMVLGRRGYETVVKGKNGFVCMVQRSWASGIDDPDFWNPKLRSPICLNAPAARSFLPLIIKRTQWILAGRSKDQIFAAIQAAIDKKKLPTQEGAMCYMMSRQGYLSDRDGRWHPHLMFFVPLTEPAVWGAGMSGSPVVAAFTDVPERLTVFLVPVGKWSDGTADEH